MKALAFVFMQCYLWKIGEFMFYMMEEIEGRDRCVNFVMTHEYASIILFYVVYRYKSAIFLPGRRLDVYRPTRLHFLKAIL